MRDYQNSVSTIHIIFVAFLGHHCPCSILVATQLSNVVAVECKSEDYITIVDRKLSYSTGIELHCSRCGLINSYTVEPQQPQSAPCELFYGTNTHTNDD
jgi:hypothetical protein